MKKKTFQTAHILAGQMTLTTRDLRDAQLYQVSPNKANHIFAHRKNEGSTIQSAHRLEWQVEQNHSSELNIFSYFLEATVGNAHLNCNATEFCTIWSSSKTSECHPERQRYIR